METPTGAIYDGLKYRSGNCGVSIIRSGEAMEQGLRDCCRSIRIGKILVESDSDTHIARVVYARFPEDIEKRQVLLMYPIMSTGNTVLQVRIHISLVNNITNSISVGQCFERARSPRAEYYLIEFVLHTTGCQDFSASFPQTKNTYV